VSSSSFRPSPIAIKATEKGPRTADNRAPHASGRLLFCLSAQRLGPGCLPSKRSTN
jgi:hypothetical protein